jgi:hypothetical protein
MVCWCSLTQSPSEGNRLGDREHPAGDAGDRLGQFGEPASLVAEHPDDQQGPLVSYAREKRAEHLGILARAEVGHGGHGLREPCLQGVDDHLFCHPLSFGYRRVTGDRLR